jgi:hypothetical protein
MRRGAAPAGLLAAATLVAACSGAGARAALRGEIDALRAEASLPAPSIAGSDAPGVLHVHTRLSHDSPSPLQEVVEAARRTGSRWVALTDHTNPAVAREQPRGEVGGVLVVPGEEISVWGGAVLALGASESVRKRGQSFEEFREEIRELGGLAFHGHATHFRGPLSRPLDGLAVYDLSDDYRATSILDFPAVLSCTSSGDPETSAEAWLLWVQKDQADHRAIWDRLLERGPVPGVAETNAHGKFRWFGRTWDPYASLLGLVRNHALVEAPGEAALLDALRAGRLHVGFDAAADTAGARFEALRGGLPAAAAGGEVPFEAALSLAVHLPAPARVRVLRDGRPWRRGSGRVLHFPVEGPGVYRAEAEVRLAGRWRPWAWFNAVRVTAPAGAP